MASFRHIYVQKWPVLRHFSKEGLITVQWYSHDSLKYPCIQKINHLHWVQKISAHSRFLGVKWLFWNQNLKMMPSEYRVILYLILKVLNRPLKWDTARLWTPTGFKNTSHQSWTFEKTFVLVLKRRFFSNVQLWRLIFLNPVGVQKRTVSHFKGLFKTFKMRYSTFLYSYWIGLHVHFKKAILHLKRATVQSCKKILIP